MKKCPPGVICVENVSMILLLFCFLIVFYLIYANMGGKNVVVNNNPSEKIVINESKRGGLGFFPGFPYFGPPTDPLLNPYNPPLSDERYFIPSFNPIPPGAVPINVSTNPGAVDTVYRQLGILTPLHGSAKKNILPLMGRPLFTNRDMWNYYSTSNQHNNIKLPLSKGGRSCTDEYGCDRLYTGDIIHIDGLNEKYKVTIYDNSVMRYLPFV
jgi:hypothetical protein